MLGDGIGYVWVMAFGRSTPNEFDTAISRLNEQGAKALVLDLRNDGGGYVDSALDISSRFIANKALLTVEERGHRDTTIHADGDPSIALPLTVLVNSDADAVYWFTSTVSGNVIEGSPSRRSSCRALAALFDRQERLVGDKRELMSSAEST